jgi:hypothetical protein
MAEKGEGSIKIHEAQWEAFYAAIENYNDLNDKESNFRMTFLQPGENNDYWIEILRNLISLELNFSTRGNF